MDLLWYIQLYIWPSIQQPGEYRVDIGYIWDEEKYTKTKEKHGVDFSEVIAAMEDPQSIDEPKNEADLDGEDRWFCIGQTKAGRLLVVIYIEEFPLYRIVTAFEAEGRWKDEYQKR